MVLLKTGAAVEFPTYLQIKCVKCWNFSRYFINIVYLLIVDNGWRYKDMNIAACPRLVATDCEAAQLYHEMISSQHRVSS